MSICNLSLLYLLLLSVLISSTSQNRSQISFCHVISKLVLWKISNAYFISQQKSFKKIRSCEKYFCCLTRVLNAVFVKTVDESFWSFLLVVETFRNISRIPGRQKSGSTSSSGGFIKYEFHPTKLFEARERLSTQLALHKKWSFPWRISSVNVIKSAISCRFGHI